jgi:hypothetical protein
MCHGYGTGCGWLWLRFGGLRHGARGLRKHVSQRRCGASISGDVDTSNRGGAGRFHHFNWHVFTASAFGFRRRRTKDTSRQHFDGGHFHRACIGLIDGLGHIYTSLLAWSGTPHKASGTTLPS